MNYLTAIVENGQSSQHIIQVTDTNQHSLELIADTNEVSVDIIAQTENIIEIGIPYILPSGFEQFVTGGYGISTYYDSNINLLTISATGLQPAGNYSLVGHSHSINDILELQDALDSKQPSGVYASGIHYHTSNDITNFASAVSGLIPASNFTSLTGLSGVSVSNSGTNYYVSLTDPTIQLSDITDLSASARLFLLTPSSNNLQTLVTNETGSGLLVFNNSPAFSGIPTVPTAPSGTNTSQIANTSFVRTEISNLINSAPSTLDTLNELAQALGNDPNFATTITNNLANKASLSGAIFTGSVTIPSGNGNFSALTVNNINVSVSGHNHQVSSITDFNSGVSGLFPNITGSAYINTTFNNNIYTISTTGLQPSGNYSIVGHTHTASEITDFNTSVSGLLPVTNILAGSNIGVSSSGSVFTVSVTGQLGLTTEEVDDRISNLLIAGSYVNLNYDDNNNNLIVSVTGVQPSGNYANSVHTHISSDITDFNSSVSGLLPTVSGTGYIVSSFSNNTYTISATGLQPSGNYSVVGHTHTSTDITDFNSSVSGLIPVKDIVAGANIGVSSVSGVYTISTDNESSALVTTVFNKTGSPISKMSAVYIDGGQGDQPTIALAVATGDPTSAGTYGVTFEAIPNMSTGKVIVFGALTGVDTDIFNPTAPTGNVNGQVLYLSPTTPGGLTLTKPSAPNHIVAIGTIVRTHQNQGVIEVRVQNGFELDELHNVAISGVTSGQFLQYNGSGLWVPSSSGNFSTLQLNGTNVSTSGHSHTSSDITDFASSVSNLLPTISNSGNYRILTSTGSNTGINAESNLTFDGTTLGINTNNIADVALSISGNSPILSIAGGSVPFISIQGTDGSVLYFNGNNGDASIVCSNSYNPTIPGAVFEALEIVSNSGILIDAGNNILFRSPNVPQWLNTSIPAVIPISISGHAHTSSDITNFNSSVSGLLPVTNILAGSNIGVSASGSVFTVAVTGQLGLTTEEVDDRVSNLLVAGTGISLNYNDGSNTLTINTSGNYSLTGHTHTASDITNFNSSVSGLLPVTNITAGSGISVSSSSGNFTINAVQNIINGSNLYLWTNFR